MIEAVTRDVAIELGAFGKYSTLKLMPDISSVGQI